MAQSGRADIDWQEIEQRYRRGESSNSIAKLYPVSRQTIMRRAKKYGWARPNGVGEPRAAATIIETTSAYEAADAVAAPGPAKGVDPSLPGYGTYDAQDELPHAVESEDRSASPDVNTAAGEARAPEGETLLTAARREPRTEAVRPETYGADPKQDGGLPELDPMEFLRVLWRRKSVIATTVVVMTGLTVAGLMRITPIYQADSQVIIGAREANIANLENVVQGLTADEPEILSQIEVLSSRRLAERVIDRVGLYKVPEFNPSLQPADAGLKARVRSLASIVPGLGGLAAGSPVAEIPAEIRAERQRTEIVDGYLKALAISPIEKSRVISISFRSEQPELAARLANTLAEVYIEDQLETKFEAVEQVAAWLDSRLGDLKGDVERSERAFEDYRSESGLTQGVNASLLAEQISQLNAQRATARSSLAEARSRLSIINQLEARGDASSVTEVMNSPTIQAQRAKQTELLRKEAELAAEYGERHPVMLNLRADLERLAGEIEGSVQAVLTGIRTDVDAAQARVDALDREIELLERRSQDSNEAQVRLRELQREAVANSALFETFLGRFKATSEQTGLEQPDARVISRAAPPLKPVSPKKRLVVAVALVFSGVLGTVLALVLEWFDRGFRSTAQLESALGIPALGFIPRVPGLRRAGRRPEDIVQERPGSAFAEMLRSLHTSILLAKSDPRDKVVLITSAVPSEGKTSLSLSLARMVRGSGQRVLLIDCDVRRPSVHGSMNVENRLGLVDYIQGGLTVHEIVHTDEGTGVDFVTSGQLTHDSAALFRAERMGFLLECVRSQYDLVILDSPPVLPLSDARILASVADMTILAVRWRDTNRDIAAAALKQLRESRANLAGAVLTQVDIKQNAKQGYGDVWRYYGKFKQYYLDPDVR